MATEEELVDYDEEEVRDNSQTTSGEPSKLSLDPLAAQLSRYGTASSHKPPSV